MLFQRGWKEPKLGKMLSAHSYSTKESKVQINGLFINSFVILHIFTKKNFIDVKICRNINFTPLTPMLNLSKIY